MEDIMQRAFQQRRNRLQAFVAERGVSGIVVAERALLSWLGFKDTALALATAGELLPSDAEGLAAQVRGRGTRPVVGFDAGLTASCLVRLQGALPRARFEPLGPALELLLAVKDELEIALLTKAAQATCRVFGRLATMIEEGRSELELFSAAYESMLDAGGHGFSFDPSIAGGERSVHAWVGVSRYRFRRGDPVLIDLGVAFCGYQCDMARTHLVGGHSAAPASAEALAAVEEVGARIRARIRPGARGSDLHADCERLLAEAGFGGLMPHFLGHGVGRRPHERPYLGPGSQDELAVGMVIAIEPGIVLGNAGFRHEDVVVVTDQGCSLLAHDTAAL